MGRGSTCISGRLYSWRMCAFRASPVTGNSAHWVTSWGTANMAPDPGNVMPEEKWPDASLRQLVHVSLGGSRLRVRISNLYGNAPLHDRRGDGRARPWPPGRPDLVPGSLRKLTFSGHGEITIPAHGEYYSDPVVLEHSRGADLAISLHYPEAPKGADGPPGVAHDFLHGERQSRGGGGVGRRGEVRAVVPDRGHRSGSTARALARSPRWEIPSPTAMGPPPITTTDGPTS